MKKLLIFLFLLLMVFTASAEKVKSSSFDHNVRLQIYLFQKNFSPGKIDGKTGKFTEQVIKLYQTAYPLETKEQMNKSLEEITPLYIPYIISKENNEYVGKVPDKFSEQAKNKYMPYKTLADLIADRFYTDKAFLKKINPKKNLNKLQPGDEIMVPNVKPFLIESISEKKVPNQKKFSKRSIQINIKNRMLLLYEGEKLLAVFPITPGSKDLPTPTGTWKIQSITYLPWYRYDKKMLNEGKESKNYYNIPPGPSSPVGIVWIGLNKPGIGIHGTNSSYTIGRSVSHGCVRLSNWDALTLSKMITTKIKVQIE